jgi:hypothetical protein
MYVGRKEGRKEDLKVAINHMVQLTRPLCLAALLEKVVGYCVS